MKRLAMYNSKAKRDKKGRIISQVRAAAAAVEEHVPCTCR